jgi:acetylornithine deacetylase/succinyl-diaminopimelate desuccinylase-like protein
LPDEDMDAFIKTLEQVIADPEITVTPSGFNNFPATPPSGLNTEMFAALERAQAAVFPGSVVIPIMQVGATDSAFLRAKGVQAYGLGTVSNPSNGGNRAHGNDERVNLAGIRPFLEFVYRAVTDVAAAK